MLRPVRKWLMSSPPPRDPDAVLGLAVSCGVAGLVSLFVAVSGFAGAGAGEPWARGVYWVLAVVWLGGASAPLARWWWRDRLGERRARNNLCPRCGYNLTGNVSGVCPECGTATAHALSRRRWR